MMNHENIIKEAADKSGMAYPLDAKTCELSEGVLRSLGDGVAWVQGKNHGMKKVNHQKYKKYLKGLSDGHE